MGVVHGQVLQKATELYCSLAFLSRTRPFMPVVHAVLDTFRRSSSDDRSITSPSVINNPEGCPRYDTTSFVTVLYESTTQVMLDASNTVRSIHLTPPHPLSESNRTALLGQSCPFIVMTNLHSSDLPGLMRYFPSTMFSLGSIVLRNRTVHLRSFQYDRTHIPRYIPRLSVTHNSSLV